MTRDWTEDLKQQAVLGYESGMAHCSCEGQYHALWGALRASGFVGRLELEEPMLATVLRPLVQKGTKILIGGAADAGTLCAIGRSVGDAAPTLSVVDQCAAPIRVIEAFCRLKKIPCHVLQEDLLNLEAVGKWDIIVLNYTYTFVSPELRPRFFAQIAASLHPGGSLICLARIMAPLQKKNADALKAVLIGAARDRLLSTETGISWDRERLEKMLSDWAEAIATRRMNFMSAKELQNMLIESGLTISGAYPTNKKKTITERADAEVENSLVIHAQAGSRGE